MTRFTEVLGQALNFAKAHYPDESLEKKASFANSVVFGVTGMEGGYGGPSIRELVANKYMGECSSFEDACSQASRFVFGQLTAEHARHWQTGCCVDDDPEDVCILNAEGENLK